MYVSKQSRAAHGGRPSRWGDEVVHALRQALCRSLFTSLILGANRRLILNKWLICCYSWTVFVLSQILLDAQSCLTVSNMFICLNMLAHLQGYCLILSFLHLSVTFARAGQECVSPRGKEGFGSMSQETFMLCTFRFKVIWLWFCCNTFCLVNKKKV